MAAEAEAAPASPTEDETKRNEVMFNLAKEVFAEELGRWTRIEDKAGRFLTVIGLMSAVLTWVGQTMVTEILPPRGWVEWALSLVMVLLFLALAGGGWFCFQALRFGKLAKMSVDKNVFFCQPLGTVYLRYTEEILQQLQRNRGECAGKIRHLERAYVCISAAFILALIGGMLITAYIWQHPA